MRAALMLFLVGCGRIAFDPLGVDDGVDDPASVALAVGNHHSCALVDGRVACWGGNDEGQLGRGTSAIDPIVGWVPDLAGIVHLGAADEATFAIDGDGVIWSWGHGGDHTLGLQSSTNRLTPDRSPAIANVAQIAGATGVCARSTDGTMTCWGDGDAGQLAIGSAPDNIDPTPSVLTDVTRVSLGADHGCGIVQGALACWGCGNTGALGVDAAALPDSCLTIDTQMVACSIAPVPVPGTAGVKLVSAGRAHTCGIFGDDRVRCWGDNTDGQLGDGSNNASIAPVLVTDLGPAIDVTSARHHTCAVLADGSAWCWGRGEDGELGNGSVAASTTPVRVAIPTRVRAIKTSEASFHTCAVDVDGNLWCWGENGEAELGNGGPTDSATPLRVTLPAS